MEGGKGGGKKQGEGENKDMGGGPGKPNRAWRALQGLWILFWMKWGVTGRFSAEEGYGLTLVCVG